MRRLNIFQHSLALIFILVLLGCGVSPEGSATNTESLTETVTPAASPSRGDAADARRVVEEFGRRLKNVSTLAPRDAAAAAIRANYAELVDPGLLSLWLDDPASAPGRAVSSPWPERIDITSVNRINEDRLIVAGDIVEVTSEQAAGGGEANRVPVKIELARHGERWVIGAVRGGGSPASSAGSSDVPDPASPEAAVDVVENYYEAINAGELDRAFRFWESGQPGQDLAEFRRGFAETKRSNVTTGRPSRIDPAAGSRYIEVPVVIDAESTSGERQRFEGTFTLRRVVVDGAPESQRRWHLYSAQLREAG